MNKTALLTLALRHQSHKLAASSFRPASGLALTSCHVPQRERQQRQECAGLQKERSDEFKSKSICNADVDKVTSRQGPCTVTGQDMLASGLVCASQCEITASPQTVSSFPVWIFRLRVFHKIDSIAILKRDDQHTNNNRKRSTTPNEPKMHDNDKTCFTFQPACLCPNSCATNDARQMRMTDKDVPHAPSSNQESLPMTSSALIV